MKLKKHMTIIVLLIVSVIIISLYKVKMMGLFYSDVVSTCSAYNVAYVYKYVDVINKNKTNYSSTTVDIFGRSSQGGEQTDYTAIGIYNIASIANSFSISGAISNYASTGSLMPSLAPSLNAGSFGITNPTNVTQFNSAKLGGDIALIFGPAAVEMAGSKVVSASKSVWTGTNMSVGDSMAYHLSKHGNGLSMGEYTEKALDFFGRYLKNSEGLRIKSVDLKTSPITSGLKISDPATGEAGIYDSLGKIVTYILPK